MKYLAKLTVVEKESLLIMAKNYFHANQVESNVADARKVLIAEERENYIKGIGVFYTWEQVKAMALDKSRSKNTLR